MKVHIRGSLRAVADLRKINAKCEYINYPTPYIEDLLYYLNGSKIFSSCDLADAYNTIPLDVSCRKYAAIQTHMGLYQFTCLPQGLSVSPNIFQKIMQDNFNSQIPHSLIIYFDDCCVHAPDFATMIINLRKFFAKLRDLDLKVRWNKCNFGYSSISLLGFQINKDGISPSPQKVETIQKLEIPKTLTHLRGFLGLCSYYRKFVKNFSARAASLNNLLKNDVPFIIGETEIAAINDIKQAISTTALLTHYEPKKKIRVEVDASKEGLGVALHIEKGDKFIPFCFGSRTLSDNEKKWAPIHWELLSIVFLYRKFRPYLLDADVLIVTDCAPLKQILDHSYHNKLSPRLLRLALQLQGYKFKIQVIPGKLNKAADFFSRYPSEKDNGIIKLWDDEEIKIITEKIMQVEEINFSEEQIKDAVITKIINALTTGGEERAVQRKARAFEYDAEKKLLFRKNYSAHGEKRLLVVPKHLINRLLIAYHDEPHSGGHFGIFRTMKKISSKYYFDNMLKIVTEYCNSCSECQHKKRAIRAPQGYLQATKHEGVFKNTTDRCIWPM